MNPMDFHFAGSSLTVAVSCVSSLKAFGREKRARAYEHEEKKKILREDSAREAVYSTALQRGRYKKMSKRDRKVREC